MEAEAEAGSTQREVEAVVAVVAFRRSVQRRQLVDVELTGGGGGGQGGGGGGTATGGGSGSTGIGCHDLEKSSDAWSKMRPTKELQSIGSGRGGGGGGG